MTRDERSSEEINQIKYIADMLMELGNMAARAGHSELSRLIGIAALAAFELETDLKSSERKEP
ncbi:MAG TPA: hypothetical protein VGA60_04625 [Kiloniellales bacterium]|jgi:hypothetical protein